MFVYIELDSTCEIQIDKQRQMKYTGGKFEQNLTFDFINN